MTPIQRGLAAARGGFARSLAPTGKARSARPLKRAMILLASMCGLFAALCGTQTSHAAQGLSLEMVYLTRAEKPRLSLAFVDPEVEAPGVWGARLALKDNQTTGRFLGHTYSLREVVVPADGDIAAAFEQEVASGHRHFIADLAHDDLLAIARAEGADGTLIFNGRAGETDLRTDTCFNHVFHTALSLAQRSDALMQFLVWKRWANVFLLSGTGPGDAAFAEAIRQSARKFGAEIVADEAYAYSPIARRTDSGHIQVQRQMPIATQGAGDDYDVLVVADENDLFGEYLPFNTHAPRPVAGTQGLAPLSWHRVQEQWGSTQFQNRFVAEAGRWMEERDYGAWLAVRAIGEAVTRTNTTDTGAVRAYLRSGDFALGGFKGVGLSFRTWNQQMRQPVILTNKRVLVSVSPQPGFLHQRTKLDSLGYDQPETSCNLQ
ncbi:ABC transporter substrate-binding protein [Breoghania sp.]|uniref:ABC transporter substrate-binding protein n=1 Tax=Breoghania sp. TaxID=2065378 RepID=UPI002AA74F2A|nr:ABC transporter substrate-binding protein [Breoghania sp.]